uniref:Uncharacterized protein n=1 Tax=Arundo donax TaxID=35708 RepID=A0A0A9E0Q8_ARUDO
MHAPADVLQLQPPLEHELLHPAGLEPRQPLDLLLRLLYGCY